MDESIPNRGRDDKGEDVYPIHLLDNANDYRNLFMSYLFRFNDILDSGKLAASLTSLLEIGDWRKLSGRLRVKEDGQLEIHVPRLFTSQSPAISFTHESFHESITTHPVGRGLPSLANTNKPSVQALAVDLRPFAGPSSAPRTTKQLISQDAPLLSLHVTRFSDSTIVVVTWPHVLMDAMGLQALMRNWCFVLNKQPEQVIPVLGSREDILQKAESEFPKREHPRELDVEKLAPGALGMAILIFRFLWLMIWSPGFEERTILLPQRCILKLHSLALSQLSDCEKQEEKKAFVSEGDVLAAWAAQILASSQPRAPMTIANFVNVRFRLSLLSTTSNSGVYIQNLLQFVYASLSSSTLAGSLGECALAYRNHVVEQSTEEQVSAYMQMQREHVKTKKKLRLVFGHPKASMLTVNNLAKIDFFRVIDFGGAVVGDSEPNGMGGEQAEGARGRNERGRIVYFHPIVLNKPSVLTSHLRVLGKDCEGNCWLTGTFPPRTWVEFERALMALDRV